MALDSGAFDLLLDPGLLGDLAPRLDRAEALRHLRTFLNLLQAERAKGGAGAPAGGLPQDDPEVCLLPDGGQTPAVSQRLASRKQAVLRLLCLQLCCHLKWSLNSLSLGLSLAQQQQLLDCLTAATDTQKTLSELGPDNVEATLKALRPTSLFSLTLFFRWVVHSACALNLPMPAGSKAQIHSAAKNGAAASSLGPDLPIPIGGGGDQGGPLHQWLLRLVPLALKVLDSILEEDLFCAMPSLDSVAIEDNAIVMTVEGANVEECKNTPKKRKKDSNSHQSHWKLLILLDLVRYHFSFEDYQQARKYVQDVEALRPDLSQFEDSVSIYKGVSEAVRVTDEHHTPSFRPPSSSTETKHMLNLMASGDEHGMPFYWRLNFEMLAREGSPQPPNDDVERKNLRARIDRGQPPSMEFFMKAARGSEEDDEDDSAEEEGFVGKDARKRKLLSALAGDAKIPKGWKEKISLSAKLSDGKSRDPKVKRRQQLSAMLRETRPTKILKHVQDTHQKLSPSAKRMLMESSDPDPSAQAFLNAFNSAASISPGVRGIQQQQQQQQNQIEGDAVTLMVARIGQLLRANGAQGLDDASTLTRSVEESEKSRVGRVAGGAGHHFKLLQRKWFAARMEAKTRGGLQVTPEDQAKCRQQLLDMRGILAHQAAASVAADKLSSPSATSSSSGIEVLELSLAALVNLEDWDFLLGLPVTQDSKFPPFAVTHRTLQLATALRGGAITLDIKRTCQSLADLLAPLVSQPFVVPGNRRSRDISSKDEGRQSLLRFLSNIKHPGFLQVIVTYLCSVHNEKAEDAACRIIHDLPPLPFPAASSGGSNSSAKTSSSSDILTLLEHLIRDRPNIRFDPVWLRLLAEVDFARGNLSSALKSYLETLAAHTDFFSKPAFQGDLDEKFSAKMVKCLVELNYHTYAVAMSQTQQQQQQLGEPGTPNQNGSASSQTDYTVSFKNLEDRQSNDAMDGLYRNLWDVTILEYAVSMHTKRGELARKKAALKQIGALEVNTNNNVEILRETAHYKRCALLRTLCLHFL